MSLLTDLHFATRTLTAKPLFTAVAIASLTLGIGANTAIFSIVESALLRSLPYDHPDRLIFMLDHQPQVPGASIAPGEFLYYQKHTKALSGLAALTYQQLTLTGTGEPQRLNAAAVTPNFFEVLGAHAETGRLLQATLDKPGEQRSAVLSDATWRGIFGSDPATLGRIIRLNGNPFRVVGVLPPNESYTGDRQIWVSSRFVVPEYFEDQHATGDQIADTFGNHWLVGIGRMRPNVTIAETRAELNLLATQISAAHPNTRDHYPAIVALHETLVKEIRPALWVLLGAVVLLLLIACSNLASLLLARSVGRTRELSVRRALGATPAQIIRLLLAESLLLALAGGAAGVCLAYQGQHWIAKSSPYDLPAALLPQMNGQVLLFCLAATLLSALLSGLFPALRSAKLDVQRGLKEGSKGSASSRANRLRQLLVGAEIALSVVLLTSACLLIHSFANVLEVNPGFVATNVTTARISLPMSRFSHDAAAIFWNRFLQQVSTLPDVESAAIMTALPISGGEPGSEINALGSRKTIYSDQLGVSPDVFHTLQIPLLSGRTFDGRETEKSPSLVVVNRTFAEKVFPNQNPLGKKFQGGPVDGDITIIGVASDVRNNGLSEPAPPVMYFSYPQYGVDSASVIIRSRRNTGDIASELRSVLHSLDAAVPLSDLKPMNDYLDASLASRRFLLALLSAFAGLAMLLAAIGLYAVLAFSVEQRTREIGIRVALGAERKEVLQLILGECSLIAFGGLTIGLIAAVWASSLLKSLLYGVTSTDYASYSAVTLLVLGIALFTSLLPAWRATRVDPVNALRYE